MSDSPEVIARDVAAVARISAVPALLKLVCQNTGMGFAAVARVTEGTWTACAVQDDIHFGLKPGGQLDVHTTLCKESRAARQPVVIDHASQDPAYRDHHTPRLYSIESYISVPIVRPNGEYFGNLCAIDPRPMRVSDARTLTMFTVFADLIAMQLDSEDARAATESALLTERATAELREQFIAVLGHDLRNPLAAVGATAELLARGRTEPDLVKMGERLRAVTRRMARLIDDVLDFARGRLGSGIDVLLEDVPDLAGALREVVHELRQAHPGRVLLDEGIAIDRPVRCDKGRVQQLLSNLVGNALSHGAPDRPVVVSAGIDDGWLAISVSNDGEPIATDALAHVFAPYWRSSQRTGGGLGLGLFICAQIAKAHGGAMAVRSSAQEGTCFSARLPV